MASLTELANQYNSDKGDQVGCCHRYASLFETIFEPFRHRPISFVEIGLQRTFCQVDPDCPSLRMWLEFFPNGKINGFDISDFSDVDIPRARIFQGDQGDPMALKTMADEVGPFDIIIDDGSHASAHQQTTLGALFSYLKPGGFYIVEDAHWQPDRKFERQAGIDRTFDIFKRFAIDGQPIQSGRLTDQQCRDIETNVASCTFSHPVERETGVAEPRSIAKKLARQVVKGKQQPTDPRSFKLIVLKKREASGPAGCETVTVRLNSDMPPTEPS